MLSPYRKLAKTKVSDKSFILWRVNLLELGLEIDYIHLKVLSIVFWELSNGISGFKFCHFSSIFRGLELCLGNGENGPVTSQGCDKIWHCFEFQSMYHRVPLCKKSRTLHKMNNLPETFVLTSSLKAEINEITQFVPDFHDGRTTPDFIDGKKRVKIFRFKKLAVRTLWLICSWRKKNN